MPSNAVLVKGRHYAESGAVVETHDVRQFTVAGHKVTYRPSFGLYACDCKAGEHGTECSHVVAVKIIIKKEGSK